MIPDYTDKEAVENYLLKEIDDGFDAQLGEWIKGVSLTIDGETGRTIYRQEPETRMYDGDGTDLLLIDDCVDITAVTIDGIAVEVDEYPARKDYTSRIHARDNRRFTKGHLNVAVTAIHAMSKTLPEDIKFAATVMVAGIARGQMPGSEEGKSEKIGNYTITYSDSPDQSGDIETAKAILKRYRRVAF